MRIIAEYFFIFILYSVCGWVMETLLFVFRDRKVVKRGFLFGPLCPIYGTGAVICTVLLYGKINNIFLLFIIGLLICGSLEYITHFAMEKLFHAMWWDYSGRRFNIKGRVYLNGLLQFGLGVVIIVKILQPLVYKLLALFSDTLLYSVCFVLYSLIIIDITATVIDLKKVISTVKYIQNTVITKSQAGLDYAEEKISERKARIEENEKVADALNWLKNENRLVRRVRAKYPNLKSKKYTEIIEIIMNKSQEGKARTDIKLYGTADSIPKNEKDNH